MALRTPLTVIAACGFLAATAAEFRVPAVNYTAQIRDDLSILPGGRVVRPLGRNLVTGTAPFAIAVSPSGKTIVTANIGISPAIGINRPSITVITPGKRDTAWNLADFSAETRQPRTEARQIHGQPWQGLRAGVILTNDNSAWVPEGDTGRIVELSLSSGGRKSSVNLNAGNYSGSFTNALVFANERNLLVALDQANSRAAVIDPKHGLVTASVQTGAAPSTLALSTDEKTLYVVNEGTTGEHAAPPSLSIIDFSNAAAPKVTSAVPLSETPSGIVAHGDEVYLSLARTDSVMVVNGRTGKIDGEVLLRIPGLESLRGITPLGLAFEPKSGRLLVAEAGINAVGVIDPAARKLLGHLPAGWFPNSIAIHSGQVYVVSARGLGTGPSTPAHRIRMVGGAKSLSFETDTSVLRRGTVNCFALPTDKDLEHQTDVVMQANGFTQPAKPAAEKAPLPIHYVVVIQKGNRTFDDILGDVDRAGDRAVLGERSYARFGTEGYVSGGAKRFSLHVDVTPNHHELARRWSFADNYYVDSDFPEAGYRWFLGHCPDLMSETSLLYREAGNSREAENSAASNGNDLWTHLEKHHIDYRNFIDDGVQNLGIPDQQRANRFIAAIQQDYLTPGKPLPRFLLLGLPNDSGAASRADQGYPYEASYIADNDLAVGRVVEFLSHTPWWKKMAIFVTESAADGGADHVDSHRTVLLGAGPWFREDYVSHTNASTPALLRTVFKLLDVPPMNLYDATAADLFDMLGAVPDFTPYEVKPEDARLFDPETLNSDPSALSASPLSGFPSPTK